jgi:hypothetical protein
MPLWGRNDQAVTANSTTTVETSNGAPMGLWKYVKGGKTGSQFSAHTANANFGNTSPGSRANVDVSMFDNVTPGAFVAGQAVGVFGVSATEMSNNAVNNSPENPAHAGWNIRIAGTGPILSVAVNANGSNFSNGETITISNGSSNATLTVVTSTGANNFANASFAGGNMASISIGGGQGGLFTNTAILATTFNRERHVVQVLAVNAAAAVVNYSNTDYIVITGNSTVAALRNARAVFTTNSTGGFTNNTIQLTDPGLFPIALANNSLQLTIYNANGVANGSGTGVTSLLAQTAPSTGGSLQTFVLGGRAGRVTYETIIASGSVGAQTASSGTPALVADATADNTYFPGT